MKIVFMGTPPIAHYILEHIEQYVDIVAVYTRPDKPAGRGQKQQYSPVKCHALEKGYALEQPKSLRTEEVHTTLASYGADAILVIAYGAIIPQNILDIPKYGAFNVHGSLLPKYRGAAPIQRALWNGEKITGATIMQLDAGMDTGAMLLTSSFTIQDTDTTYSIMHTMAEVGTRALLHTLAYYMLMEEYPNTTKEELAYLVQSHHLYQATNNDSIEDYVLAPRKQNNEEATYADKILPSEEMLLWEDAQKTHHQIQALSYSINPTASSILYREGLPPLRVKLPLGTYTKSPTHPTPQGTIIGMRGTMLIVACGTGEYLFSHIRPENKKTLTAHDFYNGYCKGKNAIFTTA